MADHPPAMEAVAEADILTAEQIDPLVKEPTADRVESAEADLKQEEKNEEADDPVDSAVDVVVTSVDVGNTGVAGSVIASLTTAASLYYHSVELVVSYGSSSYSLRRPMLAFMDVLKSVQQWTTSEEEQEGKTAAAPPEFPSQYGRNDVALARWCGDMTAFLAAHTAVLQMNEAWLAFLEEASPGSGHRTHMTAIEFILQPVLFERFYVARGSCHEVRVPVTHANQFLVWKFELEDHDVDFSVTFVPKPSASSPPSVSTEDEGANSDWNVHAPTRYLATTADQPVEGMYQCLAPGCATLKWDNVYSLIRGKNVVYQVQVIDPSMMESARAAADALDDAIQTKRQKDLRMHAIIPYPRPPPAQPESSLYLYTSLIPETLVAPPKWIMDTSISVAGKLASRLFGSQTDEDTLALRTSDESESRQAKSLLEELNGLNMQLMERLENLEDSVVKLTVERDQARSKTHMVVLERENLSACVAANALEIESLRNEIQVELPNMSDIVICESAKRSIVQAQRMQREREAWREIQLERDALLEEKHRWAMADDFGSETEPADNAMSELDIETRNRLEHELGQAEAAVLRLRAEMGYSLTNHLTGTSTRLEKIAREMTASKKMYEDQMKQSEQELVQAKQELVRYRYQKRVLVTEIRNMKTQTEGQVSVAMAEAGEARMVNRRLKKQNELLLTQIRTLVDDAKASEEARQQQQLQQQSKPEEFHEPQTMSTPRPISATSELPSTSVQSERQGVHEGDDDQPKTDNTVPYTLTAADLALLNGTRARVTEAPKNTPEPSIHRARLVAFFEEKDPSMLPEVDYMLASYKGVESSLFESLELKYSFMEINERIARELEGQ